jgi:hypothetical protein
MGVIASVDDLAILCSDETLILNQGNTITMQVEMDVD